MATSRSSGGGAESAQARVERVLREQIANGTYPLRGMVPSQRKLAEEFVMSRVTIQRALARLAAEGLLEPRRGSGTQVVRVPNSLPAPPQTERAGSASLGPLVEQAFRQGEVRLDVASLTGETLLGHLKRQYELITAGKATAPRTLGIRLLLPWGKERLAYPRAREPGDARVWERWRYMVGKNSDDLDRMMTGFRAMGVDAGIQIRRVPVTPQFKLYVINDEHMLFGPYPVLASKIKVPSEDPLEEDEVVDSLDVLGLGSILSYHRSETNAETHDSLFFSSMREWFRSHWECWPTVPLPGRTTDGRAPEQ